MHSLCHFSTPQFLHYTGMGYSQQWGVASYVCVCVLYVCVCICVRVFVCVCV